VDSIRVDGSSSEGDVVSSDEREGKGLIGSSGVDVISDRISSKVRSSDSDVVLGGSSAIDGSSGSNDILERDDVVVEERIRSISEVKSESSAGGFERSRDVRGASGVRSRAGLSDIARSDGGSANGARRSEGIEGASGGASGA